MLNGLKYRIDQTRQRLQREWRARERRSRPQAMVLMYHRVGPMDFDPWSLCVTPENFAAHMQVLQRIAQPMPLQDLALAQQSGTVLDRAVAVTFDDGYANNLHQAKPLLSRYGVPATVFVSTGYVERKQEYWWDELDRILLRPVPLPPTLSLQLRNLRYRWDLGPAARHNHARYLADFGTAPWDAKPGSRLHFYHQVWTALQPLDEADRQAAIATLQTWAEIDNTCRETHRPMRPEELFQLENGGVVSVGAHTVNHPLLSERSLDDQAHEIADSKIYLEKLLGHSINTFAYPFGAYRPETVPLLNESGFLCACTTAEETVWQGNNTYELPRFDVANWTGPVFEEKVQRWFNRGYAD